MGSRPDGTTRLGLALYGREPLPSEFLGGSEARMLHDAADRLVELDEARGRLLEFAKAANRERKALREVLRAFAAAEPVASGGWPGCDHCGADTHEPHDADCRWRLAREALGLGCSACGAPPDALWGAGMCGRCGAKHRDREQ